MLEKHLFRPLSDWANNNMNNQFGFKRGTGPEDARHFVFKTLNRVATSTKLTWVCQIDLSNAYNTVNLCILYQLIERTKFWNEQEKQLWRYLVTNAQTEINGEIVQEINGLPQGSLLSPHLFNLYLNEIFERLNPVAGMLVAVAFADDMIIAAN